MEPISVARDGTVATVTLCRPERLNALDLGMWRGLAEAVEQLSTDTALRCVVLRGAGEKAFAAGADIAEFRTERNSVEQARAYGGIIHRAMQAVAHCEHPTVAMIRGACVGGGLEIAATCDLRICGVSSRFGVPINRLGLTMAYGELQGLIDLVGRSVALEILLEGRVFGAEEALSKGLVTRVVPDEHVETEAYATAERIAAGAPLVARFHKRALRRIAPRVELTSAEWDEGFACYETADYQEGVDAFLAKRKPVFEGR